jgi:hypothetical protein
LLLKASFRWSDDDTEENGSATDSRAAYSYILELETIFSFWGVRMSKLTM